MRQHFKTSESKKINDYYTPSIEEFHVGFEYEFHWSTVNFGMLDFAKENSNYFEIIGDDVKLWEKEVVNINNIYCRTLDEIEILLKDNQIRVKILDEEDINELGFTFWEQSNKLPYGPERCYLKTEDFNNIYIWQNIKTPWRLSISTNQGKIFVGDVRNKSELKRILKQVGVIDEALDADGI